MTRYFVKYSFAISCLTLLWLNHSVYAGGTKNSDDDPLVVTITALKPLNANTCAYGYNSHMIVGYPTSPATIRLEANVTGGAPGYYYSWKGPYPDALSNAYISNPEFNPVHANNPHPSCMIYTYTVTVVDAHKSSATATVSVNVVSANVDGCGAGKVLVCHKAGGGTQKESCADAGNIPPHISDKMAPPQGGHSGCCIGTCGNKCVTPVKSAASELMEEEEASGLVLENYPDPFRISTTIRFILPEEFPVRLEVYDLSGKLIKSLFKETVQPEREYKIPFDATSDLPQGIYIYKLITPPETHQAKMILMQR